MVTQNDIVDSLRQLGIKEGDSILTHSSFKSLGKTEKGAATVIDGMLKAVGEEGTVIFPTLCQEDWENVYENWSLDAPSDVGYLTNYFRKLPKALRSNQPTHSVAAIGKNAEYITKTHGKSGLRYGIFGDTPFSSDSPWEKMYEMDTKVIFLGVNTRKCTFRHYAEYCFMETYLKKAEKYSDYEELKKQVWSYDDWNGAGVWPHVESLYIEELLKKEGKVHYAKCGDAELICISSVDFVDKSIEVMQQKDELGLMECHHIYNVGSIINWLKEIDGRESKNL